MYVDDIVLLSDSSFGVQNQYKKYFVKKKKKMALIN